MAPNIEEFLKYMQENSDCKLFPHQKELAEALINYRVKHFSGGCRSGRTTVVKEVQGYFGSVYPDHADSGREI